MRYFVILITFAAVTAASAQQPAPQSAQDQLLMICTNVSSNIAKQLDAANVRIAELTKQIADEKKKAASPPSTAPGVDPAAK